MAEHTPTPWVHRNLASDDCVTEIYGSDGELVLGEETNYAFNHPMDELHAFNCVNSHDALVKALEPLAAVAEAVFEKYETTPGVFKEPYSDEPDDRHFYGFNNVSLTYGDLRAARKALALATAEPTGVGASQQRCAESDAQSLETREVRS